MVKPIEAQNNIDLPIVVEPIEAKDIDLSIVVEPIEAQNNNIVAKSNTDLSIGVSRAHFCGA